MDVIGLREDPRQFSEVCIDAMSALAARGHDLETARLLSYFPAVRRNPYQKMLYASAFENGFAVTPLPNLGAVRALPDRMKITVHYHWIHDVFKRANKPKEAKKAGARFLEHVSEQRDAGHHLLWTIHNRMSHVVRFPDEEQAVHQALAGLVHHIHIMNPKTADLVSDIYRLDSQKLLHIPHPSYRGVYGDYMSRAQARLELGLNGENITFLCFGGLGPHKGLRFFINIWDRLQARFQGRARLVIAGAKGKTLFMEELYGMISGRSDIYLFAEHIDDQDLQIFFRASDVVVCPYQVSLNSGVAMTAATFGKPVVVPSMLQPALEGLGSYARAFTPGDAESCLRAANEAANTARDQMDDEGTIAAISNWASAHAPRHVSDMFFKSLRGLL